LNRGEDSWKIKGSSKRISFSSISTSYDQKVLEKPNSKMRHDHPRYSPPIFSPFNIFNDMDEFFARVEHSWSKDIFSEKEENQSDFYIEFTLSPEEARVVYELLLKIPLWAICRRCKGTGNIRGFNLRTLPRSGRGEIRKEDKDYHSFWCKGWNEDQGSLKGFRFKKNLLHHSRP
jgi:DnaJ-class molecular chaperone